MFVWFVANRKSHLTALVKIITMLDVLWISGSALLVTFQPFDLSKMGYTLIALVHVWIGFLAFKQNQQLKRFKVVDYYDKRLWEKYK